MGTEILDFDMERAAPAPGPDGGASAVPVLDLGDLDQAEPEGRSGPSPTSTPLGSWLAGLRTDRAQRRRLAGLVVLVLFVVVSTATVAQERASRQAARADDARLAVDVRVDRLPPVEDPQLSQAPRGQSFLPLKVHNLGPRPVHLTGLLYQLAAQRGPGKTLLNVDVQISPGQLLNSEFQVTLPCGRTPPTAVVGPATLTALVTTADRVTHVVPVDLTALAEQGGVFGACGVYATAYGAYDADSQVQADAVRITLSLPTVELVGSNFVEIGVYRSGLPDAISFATSPRLPAELRAGTRVAVTLRPVVRGCPRGMELTNLPSVGLQIGSDTYADPYLPLLVARAIGRACART
jgi:hypothetical protein